MTAGKTDIKTIREIIKLSGNVGLSDLLVNGVGVLDEGSRYGNFLGSWISQYLIYLPMEPYQKTKTISKEDQAQLLAAILDLYPHQPEAPEILSVDFRLQRDNAEIDFANCEAEKEIDHEFAKELLHKCDDRITREDFSGAITATGSLLEGVFDDIHRKVTGNKIGGVGDLRSDYKKVKRLLNLSDERFTNEAILSILGGVTSIVSGLGALNNQMGDRHKRIIKPDRRHAKLCVSTSYAIVDFLYGTLAYQETRIADLLNELIGLLDSDLRFEDRDTLVSNQKIVDHMAKYDNYLKHCVRRNLVNTYDIGSYRRNDIFFAIMRIFFDDLTEEDIVNIFDKNRDNDQALGLDNFLRRVSSEKPDIVNKEIRKYLEPEPNDAVEDVPF